MIDTTRDREAMVKSQLRSRGIEDEKVLDAMRSVPRERFVPEELREFAYQDSALPIEEEQTISQPYIVALMAQAAEIDASDRVLEIGAGSGYAAAVLAEIAEAVVAIERHASLASNAGERLRSLGYENARVVHADGTLGWPERAPYDAIVVSAGGPDVPEPLLQQLKVGGRMVIPVGPGRLQELVRIRRTGRDDYEREEIGSVAFVPLVGAGFRRGGDGGSGSGTSGAATRAAKGGSATRRAGGTAVDPTVEVIQGAAEPVYSIDETDLTPLLDRIGSARVVLLGEASHGTAEFYDMRARITRELVQRHGFNIVAVEADWPDAAQIDRHVRGTPVTVEDIQPFTRFPAWMWANGQVARFVGWLKTYNESLDEAATGVGFYGLDLYSLYVSIAAVLEYLDEVDPESARVARQRYGCLTPWEADPVSYGAAALSGRYRDCESQVVAMLSDLLRNRLEYAARDGERFFDASQNARLIANAEKYYRTMYYGSSESWNLRDRHMFETLEAILKFRGPESRAVVWEHNSHIGDARATEMSARGQLNVGQLCRERFGDEARLVGFGTDHGTVAAASEWDGPMEIMDVRPAHPRSHERLCHESRIEGFVLPVGRNADVRETLRAERLERAIGVIYRSETELQSHYFHASLPDQFDEYIWFDETKAVTPLRRGDKMEPPETFPYGV
ncbi:MAG: protein-L-isoaspartate(D-aspartate) O-methyltransferase [Gemmatimonadetes bacterium]|uniref:Protein-L-isoaspartate O-methyltransferase n=1 Tax=Candidatus Kutchimonas denitrificans TaxID=3056748 RepID=A0AAE5CB31_9BACT|nr:protein-L-isoaspartate(D-aspartate) O-methyltransferase [Gemmatimonadota bacterium]NIR74043.1 protein-L-isoaspartate(D-aspartate) O-methyltransferase [Candidatus Kutchimonas denitrificans]NIS03032.1 protein-L-isoaspartate(D-aspartate) O-methyltransferase [Gemmatimonadota bacterium]NIT68749.1 protein-L-isoaspartate(D-aspartate) O-methyltransferase [Gemmatimonadota bacterium]NIU53330.1 protein-L-isoaspartate(D-aspartate) O-methyltransferase [Gemmatimonadota bacterium]